MTDYHNTTDLTGEELRKAKSNAKCQDNKILKFFEDNPEKEVTSEEIWMNLFDADTTPITSIRRSLNTLRDNIKYQKIENIPDPENNDKPIKKPGFLYGNKIFVWRLRKNKDVGQLELFPGINEQLDNLNLKR